MSAKSRRKGHNFERRLARELKVAGYDARRNLTETREGNTGDILFEDGTPIVIQAKCYEKRAPWRQAVREAEEAAERVNAYAVAVTKTNNDEPIAHIPWHHLLQLLALKDVRLTLQRRPFADS